MRIVMRNQCNRSESVVCPVERSPEHSSRPDFSFFFGYAGDSISQKKSPSIPKCLNVEKNFVILP
jgi:hypothetical protein